MKKPINAIFTLKPPIGQNEVSLPITLETGFIESIVAVPRYNKNFTDSGKPIGMIFIGLKSSNQDQIIPKMPLDLFLQRGGKYTESFKPLNMASIGGQYVLTLNCEKTSTGIGNDEDVEIFVIFNYDTKTSK